MTKRPAKVQSKAQPRSYTLRNRIALALLATTAVAVAVWSPWSAPPAPKTRSVAAIPTPPPSPSPAPVYTTASAPAPQIARMSATLEASFDAWLIDAYKACWSPPKSVPDGDPYLPRVRVALKADGTLASAPRLINPPWDPAWRPHADAAVRAVKACDPLHVPDKYAPYYTQWRTKTVFFDPTRS